MLEVALGNLDIIGNEQAINYRIAPFYAIDQITFEDSDMFYVERPNFALASFANILVESKLGLGLLLVALLCTSLVLSVADRGERNHCQFSSTMDNILFLLGSFYATSSPIPRRKSYPLTRAVVYSVWFIAILPLSNYLRSELVSRLSVHSHGEVMDTMEKVDDALSRKALTPCLRIGSMTHLTVTRNLSYTKFHTKLSIAFYAAKERKSLESIDAAQCLSCARQKDHICFTGVLSTCSKKMTRGFVESKDRVNPVLAGMVVRKNFALKVAFRNLVRRIRETGFFSPTQSCSAESQIDDNPATMQQSDQLTELSQFIVLFVLFLAASTAVFILELAIGNL
ncbi:hypothetical protein HPB49_013156 [Dermacentor silvarum]|uniref:Uncharacterized protein n=1 Tax=Dermacentor silvarum TaxID=543639 RepID=A0ACB8CL75_DERSI|nr:hypothetical protein HPB49_013156 [Dermacentor silvarum]